MLVLVTGLTGAGKSTYCREYTKRCKSYSIDNWMKALYWQDMPERPDMQWFVDNSAWYAERMKRCEDLIQKEVLELFGKDIDILLDLGFTSREQRGRYIELARAHGEEVQIYHLEAPKEERLKRIEKRNAEKTETYVMEVTKEMVDYIEEVFEEFTPAEKEFLRCIN